MDYKFLVETFFVALSGVPTALFITIVALLVALPLGFLLALTRINQIPVLNRVAQIYVSFVRGTPVIIQIFIIYSSVPLLLASIFDKYNIEMNVYDVNPIWYAFIVFSLNTTAILIEVFRSAISTVSKGQLEAAYSVGLTNVQAFRRIIIPQTLVVALPNICTATVNLIKATSLGYALSLQEITLRAKVAANVGYNYVEAYIDIFLVYLILCSLVEYLFKLYEKRLSRYRAVGI
ncbi:amino acid ABC transporter permease [Peribacillus butanolivorans]|uniref:Amino acid ABC transporter permease n=1 Tax=Peribacillus butanolivorans TaxID=421767 RepID=A0AAX0RTE6_9BACI|nr:MULTISPECIES: amino acid ABC transporter permease [unclassified Peribacillus]AXN41926.1 amino acid ABC transporter permease [Peribacillus butanolivorans]MBK5446561.1 amino acid ABC transporter permease [Peribacillus sp. TH24]MBK5458718.1 amino acid ABC transporter permease [Peribacillus sp. TH27]MBK5502130.1 amino acid ABC transporter permease [Peribacillus sp. TH14]PEJ37803.1 amino acid ABC transporter permease [Peribacillus butanolivorans]